MSYHSYKNIPVLFLFMLSMSVFGQDSISRIELKGKAIPGGLMLGFAPDAREVFLNGTKIKTGEKGVFILGFDRDDTGKQALKVLYANGTTEQKDILLEKRTYNVQRINDLDQKYVSPPAEILEKIERESKMITEARKKIDDTDTAYYVSGFMRPVEGGRISGIFGSQRILNGEAKNPHNGIDIALPTGTAVYAMADGKVCLKGDDFHYNGNFVLLDHGHGLNSVYVHLHKTFVQNGDVVLKGQKIGEVGSTGRSTGPHLHWGVQWYKKRIDPQLILELDF